MKKNIFKSIISVLLTLIMIITALPLTAVEGFAETSGDWEYENNWDGTATVIGYTGSAENLTIPSTFDGLNVTSIRYNSLANNTTVKSLVIPEGITDIGGRAFENCTSLESITIPSTVTSMNGAFDGCTSLNAVYISDLTAWLNLSFCTYQWSYGNPLLYAKNLYLNGSLVTDLVIPEGVTSIGGAVFAGCTSIKSVTIPSTLTSLGYEAFGGCTSIEKVYISDLEKWCNINISFLPDLYTGELFSFSSPLYYGATLYVNNSPVKDLVIPDGVTTLGNTVFAGCSIESVTIPSSVTTIYSNAFSNCASLKSVNLPDDFSGIGVGMFENCTALESITVPEGATEISLWAFSGCSALKSITVPDSVTILGEGCFGRCTSLETVTLGSGVDSIDYVFYECPALKNINVSSSNPYFSSVNGVLFNKDKTELIIYPSARTNTSYSVPNTVKSIADSAFEDNTSLVNVNLPDSVTSIGYSAFNGCTSLESIGNTANIISVGSYAFENTALYNLESNWENKVFYIGKVLLKAKQDLSGNYTVKSGTKSIANSAFDGCESLTGITIPNSVTSIGSSAFYYCTSLTSITIPDSISNIGSGAFLNTEYYNNDDNWDDKVLYVGNHLIAVNLSFSGEYSEYSIKEGTKTIADGSFKYCGWITSITIPDSVTSISDSAFSSCTSLTSITIPDSVTSISDSAFSSCTSLTSITIPDSVTSIGRYAFYGCTSLTSITIPDSVTSIGDGAFSGCTSLTSITIPDSVTSIGSYAFSRCTSLKSVTIPDSVTSIGDSAFFDCSSLASVTIPESVNNIGKYSFGFFMNNETYNREKINGFKIYGYSDSAAETYANENGIPFAVIDDMLTEIIGDLNGDGAISIGDYSCVKSYLNGGTLTAEQLEAADLNNDGTVDAFDLFYMDRLMSNIGLTDFNYTVTSGNNAKITGYNATDTAVKIPARIDGYTITNIDNYAFKNNSSIKSVNVIEGIKAVNYGAFLNCTSLETVELSNTVTSIASYGFKGCSNLAKITIPASVTSIQATAFDNCPNVKIYGEQGSYAETFANDKGIPFICFSYEVISGNNVKITGYNGDESELTIPAKLNGYNVTTIYNYAFRNNTNIKTVKLESGIKTISYGAFLNCTNLKTVELPDSATTIGTYAFKGCTKLTKITIPASVTSIQATAFDDCPNVKIYCEYGSYAETFANNNYISFCSLY